MDQKKKRLLVFTSTFPRWQNDSKPSFVFELSKRLTKTFDVFVLAPHSPNAKKEESLDGIEIKRFNYFIEKFQGITGDSGIHASICSNRLLYFQIPFFIVTELIALMRYVRKIKPDLIHAHWVIPQGFLSYLNYKIFKTPYTITSHGSDILGIRGFNFFKRMCLKNSKRITVVSKEIRDKILGDIDPSLKIDIIPMGVDTKIFSPEKKDRGILNRYKIKGPFLLFVGRLSPEKGLRYLLEAMSLVIKEHPKAKLLIIGDGSQKNELEHLTKKMKLDQAIIFIGKLPNLELPRYYATADAFICPSLREGSPVSYIESLACGTPIIVGDLPISREIIHDNRGFLVKQKDPSDIAQKVINLLKTYKKSKNELHTFARNVYDWDIIAERFRKVLSR